MSNATVASVPLPPPYYIITTPAVIPRRSSTSAATGVDGDPTKSPIKPPQTAKGWLTLSPARPEALNLLYRQDPSAAQQVSAALNDPRWVNGMIAEATRVAYEDLKKWAVEVPVRDGGGAVVGRLIMTTSELGNGRFYHEGNRGVVGMGPSFRSGDELVQLSSPLLAFAANSLAVDGVTFVAECAGWRNPEWRPQTLRPVITSKLGNPELKTLLQRLLAA